MLLMAAMTMAQASWVNEPKSLAEGVVHAILHSAHNNADIGYSIYLPKGYGLTKLRLPLILFLHGSGGSEVSDCGPGGYTAVVDHAVQQGIIPESVVLFVNGRQSGYRDHPERNEFIETFIVQELIPAIEKKYRTGGSRKTRIATGFSMGGAGACNLSLNHPDLFGAAIAWGSSVRDGNEEGIALLKLRADQFRKDGFRFYMGVGETDNFAQAPKFRDALAAEGIRHQYRVLPGIGHDLGAYYRLTSDEAFRFVAPALNPNRP
jgi:enterochelin esterase-like enzyme